MARRDAITVLFLRPPGGGVTSDSGAWAVPPEAGWELPVPLLALASAVKFGSRHRVAVVDRRPPQRGLDPEALVAVHRPDAAFVQLHPSSVDASRREARALRSAGCRRIHGLLMQPLTKRHKDADFDDLFAVGDHDALFVALGSKRPGGPQPTDRKLLDYARYPLAGRARAGAASRVLLHDESGHARDEDALRAEIAACDLLGIHWKLLACSPGSKPPPRIAPELLALPGVLDRRDPRRPLPDRSGLRAALRRLFGHGGLSS